MGAPLLGAILIFAPLIKGGNRPIPLLLLELAALLLLAQAVVRPAFAAQLTRPMLAALGAVVVLPLLQIVPLPEFLWSLLPGRDFYAAALASIGNASTPSTLSLIPRATEAAWLTLLPPVAVFLATVALPDDKLKTMVHIFIAMAVVQALIGLAQFGTGSVTIFWPAGGLHDGSSIGTYANRDHLAGLLEMALPVALALLAASIHRGSHSGRQHHRRKGLRQRIGEVFSHEFKLNRAVLLGAASIAILLGLVFTRSRTGLALSMLAILLCALAFARRIGGERSAGLITVFSVIGLALAVEVGLAPVLGRFTDQSVAADLRWSIFSGTIAGIGEFFPFGSGIGTFPEIFRRFQPGDVPRFVNHAHNDYLELLFEGGLVAGALIAVILVLYIRRWPKVWTREHWSALRFVQVAAGISVLLLGLHGLIDFNLHIPANAIYFAFLAGVFFHQEEVTAPAQHRPKRHVEPPPELKPAIESPPPENARNPFAE